MEVGDTSEKQPRSPRVVGVVPAAGYATRLQPLPGSKEMLPVGGRPVMDYVIERMRLAPCSEVRVVTRPEKEDVIANASASGANVIVARPRSLSESIATGLSGLAAHDIVLVGLPDTIWEPRDGYAQLVAALADPFAVVLGLFRTADLDRSDVVTLADSGVVEKVEVKPLRPASGWIWGCFAARVFALSGLERGSEPGDYLDSLCASRRVAGVPLSDVWIDIGTKAALERFIDPAGRP
jgi:glucose-1-phosphate thymidylyltransferase